MSSSTNLSGRTNKKYVGRNSTVYLYFCLFCFVLFLRRTEFLIIENVGQLLISKYMVTKHGLFGELKNAGGQIKDKLH